ncbi:MAG: PLP-dependent transferase [Planctomycetales bacterium]|nr:PLP-dependent transferase [Planctomycetales bacterium]
MNLRPLDFRSDTLTQPTAAMKEAILAAPLGDDVFSEDPTIQALQQRVADLLGKEAALFVPSGTMSNQIAIRAATSPGDEVLCEAECHIHYYEQGAPAQLSGVAMRPIQGERGVLQPEQLIGMIRPSDDHFAQTRLICLENTHNRGGGRIQPLDSVAGICEWAHEHGLLTHLDGARLMNAVVATGVAADQWSRHFDSVSICFSKGLGAPVGSALAGSREFIRRCRRHRKVLGGGMRQGGIIAAAALYAIEHHVERLAEDHQNAKRLARAISGFKGVALSLDDVQTNMIVFEISPSLGPALELVAALRERGVKMLAIGPQQVRAVTHLDVGRDEVDAAVEIIGETLAELTAAPAQGRKALSVGEE